VLPLLLWAKFNPHRSLRQNRRLPAFRLVLAIAASSRSELSSKLPPTAAPIEATTSQPALVLPLSRANLQYVVEKCLDA